MSALTRALVLAASLMTAGGAHAQDAEPVEATDAGVAPAAQGEQSADPSAETGEFRLEDLDPSLYRLDGITIEMTAEDIFRTAGSATQLDERLLRRLDYVDPHSIVLQAPGVYVRTEDGYGLRPNIGIRGANSDRSKKITLMEDGVLFGPAPYSAPAAYYFPLMQRMVGVDVFKGPSAVLFGPQTVGGAIDFRTRDIPEEPSGAIDLAFGNNTFLRLHGHYGASNRWGGILLEVAHLQSEGFKRIDFHSNDDTGFSRTEVTLRLRAQSNPDREIRHRIDLKLNYGRERSNETYLGLSDADFRADPYRRYAASDLDQMNWWHTSVVLSHRLSVGDIFQLDTAVYRNDLSRQWRKFNRFPTFDALTVLADPNNGARRVYYDILTGAQDSDTSNPSEALLIGTNDRVFFSEGVQTNARIRFDTGDVHHDIRAGLRLHLDQARRLQTEDPYWMIAQTLVPTGGDTTVNTNDTTRTLAFASYAAYAVRWKGLTLTPGLRVEHIRGKNHVIPTDATIRNVSTVALPGVGLQYEIIDPVAVFAGVYRGFSPAITGQGSSPELSVNYELGTRYRSSDSTTSAELTGFFNDYSNLTADCSFADGCFTMDRQFSAGRVFIYGFEALASHSFDLGKNISLPLRATYTFTRSSFRTNFESDNPQFGRVEKGDELPYVPMHQFAAQVGVEREHEFQANLNFTIVSRMRETAGTGDDGLMTDNQYMLDFAGRYRIFPKADITLRAENLLFQQPIGGHRPFGARPIRPFQIQVGFAYEL